MNIEIFTLCDAATDSFGKLNILGSFDTIITKSLPAKQPQCAVVLKIRFTKIEEGNHNIKINLINEDGKSVIPTLVENISVKMPEGRSSASKNIIICANNLKFDKEGDYSIDLAIDGKQEKSLPLKIIVRGPKSRI